MQGGLIFLAGNILQYQSHAILAQLSTQRKEGGHAQETAEHYCLPSGNYRDPGEDVWQFCLIPFIDATVNYANSNIGSKYEIKTGACKFNASASRAVPATL